MIESTSEFDSARLEMLWSRLLAISDEMAVTLTHTAFSMIVRDAHDYGCSVFDANANMIAIGEDATPGLSVSAMVSLRNMLAVYPAETLRPGDVLIMNDPWLATGHLLDLTIVRPVFHQAQLAGYVAAVAHHMDIGGRKTTPASTEIYEEGLYLPVLKLYDQGRPNDTLFRILESNVRVPEMVLGDVHAQLAANELGAKRVCDLLSDNGWSDLNALGGVVLDRAEAAMREAITAVPDGEYRGELVIDGFDDDLRLVATISVAGSELRVDFSGTSPQIDRGINCVFPITQGIALIGLQLALRPDVPTNAGVMRPITMTAPPGSLLAAEYPAPVVGRSLVLDHLQPLVFIALAEALPDSICAVSGGPIWSGRVYGERPDGDTFFVLQQLNGGMGARPDRDGISALSFPNNVATVPVELWEDGVPLLVERKGLIPDSGGPGRFRGGLSQEFRVRVLCNDATLPIRADRTRNPAPGLFGGGSGRNGKVLRNESETLHPKSPSIAHSGDVVSWQLAGGGGYGDPLLRNQEHVLADVLDGFVSAEAAERDYSVVVKGAWPCLALDREASDVLRSRRRDALAETE